MKSKLQRKILYAILLVSLSFTVIISLLNYNNNITESRQNLINNMNIIINISNSSDDIINTINLVEQDNVNEEFFVYEDYSLAFASSDSREDIEHINRLMRNYQEDRPMAIDYYIETDSASNIYYIIRPIGDNSHLLGTFRYDSMFQETLKIIPLALLPTILGLILIPNIIRGLYKSMDENLSSISSNIKEFIYYGPYDIDVDPEFEGFLSSVKEDTEDVWQYIHKLQSHSNALDKLSIHMKEGFIILDENSKVISVNTSAIKLLNSSMLVNYVDKDILHLCRNPVLQNALRECIEKKDNIVEELDLYSKHLRLHINPIFNKSSSLLGIIILIIDETEIYELEKIRREFTSNVSHELKTPLTSIRGYAELISSGMLPQNDSVKFSKIIINESNRLIELIESIISISRLEEHAYTGDITEINLFNIIEQVKHSLNLALTEKNISFSLTGESSLTIRSNLMMIEELLYNLIDNAINYNVIDGKIRITVKTKPNDNVVLIVEDTGIGISYDDQEKIFQRFYMADKSRSYNKKSTGLGLSIVKHIVENLDGVISLESQLNFGSKFIVEFPKELTK